ncbi:MAG: OmpH family outer membrane protein [Weeksellaceae bacterium]|jgi:outer membrane protein|nr:OmpH family outer membrane protein [Weeksellaceae bacterium]MDX9705580.1 OmpH family outer membrane protein [Weeksellaceae bacterium]
MKNLKFLTVFAFLLIGSVTLSAQDFGVVDVQEVLNNYSDKKAADTTLDALVEKHQTAIQQKQNELQEIENYFQTIQQTKNEAEIQAMMPELEAKRQEYINNQQALVNYQQAAAKELQEKEDSLMRPIEQKVQNSINKVAAEKGLKYVIEKSMLLYSNGIDITADVKKDLGIK